MNLFIFWNLKIWKIAYFLQIKITDLWQCTIRTPTAPTTFPFHCPMLSGSYCCCCRHNKLQLERLRSLSASGQLLLPIMLCFRFWPIGHLSPCALWTFAIGPRHCQKQSKRNKRKRSWKSSIKRVRMQFCLWLHLRKEKEKESVKVSTNGSRTIQKLKSLSIAAEKSFFLFPFQF